MGHPGENDAVHEARVDQDLRAFAAALLARDEIGAEVAIREAIDARLTTAEIDDEVQRVRPSARFDVGGRGLTSRMRPLPGIEVCTRVSEAVGAVDAAVKQAGMN